MLSMLHNNQGWEPLNFSKNNKYLSLVHEVILIFFINLRNLSEALECLEAKNKFY